jgi:hypothetical protein
MKFDERKYVIECLHNLESNYPVDTWKINEMHIWPLLKKIIFYQVYLKVGKVIEKEPTSCSRFQKLLLKFRKYLMAFSALRKLRLSKVDFIFSGASPYRVSLKNKSFNRYFDPIMDYLEKQKKNSYIFEYDCHTGLSLYKKQRVIQLPHLLPFFSGKGNYLDDIQSFKKLEGFSDLFGELKKLLDLEENVVKYSLVKQIKAVNTWANLYEFILKKTQPKYVLGLCYYSNAQYGLNLAASKLGITSIDMQHGSQGPLHFAYYFTKIPEAGFNILPRVFWMWDEPSYRNILRWTNIKSHYPVLGGNPWIEMIKKDYRKDKIYNGSKPMILFTLQPLDPIIDDYFLEVMSLTSNKYNWWLRLHPRMSQQEISILENKLKEISLYGVVNLQEASTGPLPVLLQECDLHVSRYSGSISEAALVNRFSLIIDEIGKSSFEELIENKLAFSCLSRDSNELIKIIEMLISQNRMTSKAHSQSDVSFKKIIDEFTFKLKKKNN